ncbi:uncharacterized protein [Channa argus]|uniref:uncharacterized protein isoform X2 n=1 Tax=Channa argus TaxID=215402 RepID=UPI00352196D3
MANWSHEETRALLSVWSDEKIQRDLEGLVRNERVYREVSDRLAAMGMSRSAKQCRQKIKKLKLEYRKSKLHSGGDGANIHFGWYSALDTIVGKRAATADNTEHLSNMIVEFTVSDADTDSPTTEDLTGSCSDTVMPHTLLSPAGYPLQNPQDPHFYSIQLEDIDGPTATTVTSTAVQTSVKDTPLCCWSSTEVQALLTLWANPAVQEELLLNVRNNKVYTHLSAKLASLGFNKAPKKCREKIKKLKQEYKRIKNSCRSESTSTRTSVWFAIMDDVLSSQAAAAKHSGTAEPSLPSRSQSFLDVTTNEEIQWMSDEVQVLMTLWAQPNIQKELHTPAANNRVYTYLSNELALVGFKKTPHQCSLKVNNLIEEYRKIKEMEPHGVLKSDWLTILDGVLGSEEASTAVDSSTVLTQPESPEHEHGNDMLRAAWTSDEVKVLLTRWADESVQEQLRSTQRNERVFAQLSSELATQGFDKTTSQCRSKIKLLKRKYKRVKEQRDSKKPRNRWFAIMDKVLGHHKPELKQAAEVKDSTPASLQTSQHIIAKTVENIGCHLSLSSLRLLVPTLRLMCAFAWQVVQCCNVVHYGKVEELVGLGTELAPELLTPREKVQLLLRLRARFVLELCRSETTANLPNINPHLKVIQDLTMGSSCDQEVSLQELEELENSKSNFVEVVYTLLEDPEERQMFFQEVFPLHYGQPYQALLNTLVWKFISRLDVLLPIPDIKQTAEWLSTAPSVMEECGQLVLESHELKALLHFHQQRSGNTNDHDSLAQNIFLPRLSLPPKAKMKQLAFEKPEMSTGDEAEDQYEYSEDEEPVEENHSDEKSVDDCSEENEDLKLKDKHNDDLTAANFSNVKNNLLSRKPVCSLCPCSDSQVSDLLQHIRKKQVVQKPVKDSFLQKVNAERCSPEMGSITNTCEYCGKVFMSLSILNKHIKAHTMLFQCDKCEKKYVTRDSLNVHRRIHTGEMPYLCSHCGRGFRSSCIFKSHVRIHTGERRYKCHICGKTSIQHLARHMRMHRGEKNYLCTECGKAFLSSGELRLHMRFHTGERPYTCKHCGRGFRAKCQLTVHIRQHTGECPYRCPVCPKSFHTLNAQKRHVLIHSNKKSFQCLKCGKIFRQEVTFKMHVQTHKEMSS